jgi:hypothetical protein
MLNMQRIALLRMSVWSIYYGSSTMREMCLVSLAFSSPWGCSVRKCSVCHGEKRSLVSVSIFLVVYLRFFLNWYESPFEQIEHFLSLRSATWVKEGCHWMKLLASTCQRVLVFRPNCGGFLR